jgi:hypothetical protein
VHDLFESLPPPLCRGEPAPPAIELWTTHQPRVYEVALLLLLLDAVFLHHIPEL